MRAAPASRVREIGRTAEFALRRWTAPARMRPAFLIIGAQRAGTTSLYEHLTRHPAIPRARRKEIHFFDREWARGPEWYFGHFPSRLSFAPPPPGAEDRRITGEASPYYLFDPRVPARVASLLPGVRLIALLRNPADRAISQVHHERRKGREDRSLADALALEPERLAAAGDDDSRFDSDAYRSHAYVARGRYAEQLERWFAFFPPSQILVLSSEELFRDPRTVYRQVLDFLWVPRWEPKSFPQRNAGEYAGDEDVRRRLIETFRPENERLYALLGRDFGWERE